MNNNYDPTTSPAISAIVRAAVIVSTLALFVGSLVNAVLGYRDIAVVLALAAPLGISAFGFLHAGHNEAAMGLLCCVLITVVTLILALNPLGVHDMAIIAYGGIVLFGTLLFNRKSSYLITGLVVFAATSAFVYDLNGFSRSEIEQYSGWSQYGDFLMIIGVFAVLGRNVAEKLFGTLGEAHAAASQDNLTGLKSRPGFMMEAAMRLRAAHSKGESAALVVVDLDGFRRTNLVIGHQAADNVLQECSRRLAAEFGGDLVGRLGDDEFGVLRTGLHEGHIAEFARVVHKALDFEYLGVSVRNAAGFARFPRDANGIESLMMAAETSLVASKDEETERYSGPGGRI
jgi:diguanylate cyclase (GGDEF)-like protein